MRTAHLSNIFIWGYYGTQYRVYNFISSLGYSTLYKEYNLTRFNHQKRHYSSELMWECQKHGLGFLVVGFRVDSFRVEG